MANKQDDDMAVDGMTYSYTSHSSSSSKIRRQNARASSFVTVGPSLLHPDLVMWSEEADLCCISVGSRVTIYSFKPPSFVLLGTVLLFPMEHNTAEILSSKFTHCVLF